MTSTALTQAPTPTFANMNNRQQHRVLIYATCYNVLDGVTLTIRKIEEEILAQGHHVCIVSTTSGVMSNTHMDGEHPNRTVIFLDNSVPIPFLHDPNNPECSYQLGFSLSNAVLAKIEDFGPTIIHITTADSTASFLLQYARTKEIPLMGTYHSNIPEYMEHYRGIGWLKYLLAALFRHHYNFLQALYVPTPFIHKYLCDSQRMDCVTDLQVWGRGIDLDLFTPNHRSLDFRRKLGFSDDDVVICWVGRLVPEKRPDIFAHVVRQLHENNVPFKALVIGAGPCEEEIKALPNTVFAGWMTGDQLRVAYSSSDVFLFPSAVETFGNVTLEAAASGLPLVVEQGCSGHLVRHGINGFACHEDDIDAWYDSTLCVVLDDARRKSMSAASRAHSMNFEKRTVCRKMIVNYGNVTDQFYNEYGGHHANRDKLYTKEHSFIGGTHPRPFVLILIEQLFSILFRVMYNMASLFFYMREKLLPTVDPTAAALKRDPMLVSTKVIVSGSASKSSPKHVPVAPTEAALPLRSIREGDDESDSDADVESVLHNIPVASLLSDDHSDTDTTASTDSDDSANSDRSSSRSRDCKPSHELAKAFVTVAMFQFRMESNLRHFFAYLCSPSEWTTVSTTWKRKESIGKKSDLSNASVPNDSLDASEVMNVSSSSSSRMDRMSLRRTNSQQVPLLVV